MAYIRWSEGYSDVYLIDDGSACYCCLDCQIEEDANFLFRSDVISHLLHHRFLGDKVPEWVIDIIEEEMRELGDGISCYSDLIINLQ